MGVRERAESTKFHEKLKINDWRSEVWRIGRARSTRYEETTIVVINGEVSERSRTKILWTKQGHTPCNTNQKHMTDHKSSKRGSMMILNVMKAEGTGIEENRKGLGLCEVIRITAKSSPTHVYGSESWFWSIKVELLWSTESSWHQRGPIRNKKRFDEQSGIGTGPMPNLWYQLVIMSSTRKIVWYKEWWI